MNIGEIEKLLEDGLTLYGFGKIEEAIAVWRKVLEIDHENQKALDYIESAGYGRQKQETAKALRFQDQKAAPTQYSQDTEFININYIKELLKSHRYELAYEFLEHLVGKDHPSNKQLTAYFSIVKAQLIKTYYEELYNFKKVPKLNINEQDIIKYNLSKTDGYIISMIDGYSDIEEIIQMCSNIDRFDVMKRFYKLTRLGVIGF